MITCLKTFLGSAFGAHCPLLVSLEVSCISLKHSCGVDGRVVSAQLPTQHGLMHDCGSISIRLKLRWRRTLFCRRLEVPAPVFRFKPAVLPMRACLHIG